MEARAKEFITSLVPFAAVLALLVALAVFGVLVARKAQPADAPRDIPPFTSAIEQELAARPTFEALVSYTNVGFEPLRIAVSPGDTIRFVNNSSHTLRVVSFSAGTTTYPGSSACGATALDSCVPLAPREFWQFTFAEEGVWNFRNEMEPENTGFVEVR